MTKEEKPGPPCGGGKFEDSYLGQLIIKRDKDGLKRYSKYQKEHAKRLRRLEREANGELLPGEYYAGN